MQIAKYNDKYVIRRFEFLLGWRVADKDMSYWWPKEYKHHWELFDTEEEAVEAVIRYRIKLKLEMKKTHGTKFVRWI